MIATGPTVVRWGGPGELQRDRDRPRGGQYLWQVAVGLG